MRIAQLSRTPIAGIPAQLSLLINRHTSIESICLSDSMGDYPDGRQFDRPTHLGIDNNLEEISKCDVIHLHNFQRVENKELRDILRTKPVVVQYHSPDLSPPNKFTDKKQRWCTLAQRYIIDYPDAIPVPNIVSVSDYSNIPIIKEKFDISKRLNVYWSPSNIANYFVDGGRVNNSAKGYAEAKDLIESVGNINFELIMGVPINDLMSKKQDAHLAIDDLVTGGYHRNTLEYLLLGVPVICKLAPVVEQWLIQWGDGERPPIININDYKQIKTVLDYYSKNVDKLYDVAIQSRDWMNFYWNESRMLQPYLRMYREVFN